MRWLGLICNCLALIAAACSVKYWWLSYFAYLGGFMYGLVDWREKK